MIKSRPKVNEFGKHKSETGEGVVEKKNALLATLTINFCGEDVQLHQISAPFVVIVHNTQETIAYGTVLWDSAFYNENDPLTKFEVGPWSNLARALTMKFKLETNRELTQENLNLLYQKISLDPHPPNEHSTVTWTQFAKDKLDPNKNQNFTFWEWIYASLKLIINNAAGMWQHGFIEGFIAKESVKEKLQTCETGTFMLRFSETVKGALTIAYVQNGNVLHLKPFTKVDLEARSLIDRLHGLNQLKFIYPDVEKTNAIGEPQKQIPGKDYVDTEESLPIVQNNIENNVTLQDAGAQADVHVQNLSSFVDL